METVLSIEFDLIDAKLKRINPKSVLLQLPSGLKRKSSDIAREIRRRYGCDVLISGDSCYGACDIVDQSNQSTDAIIQIGHAPMPTVKCSKHILFVPVKISYDLEMLIGSAIPFLKSPVGLLSTAQHLHQLDETKRLLEMRKFKTLIGGGSRRIAAPGHVLGCDYSSATAVSEKAKSYLLLGGGRFHAIGASLMTGKPVIVLDPERKTAVIENADVDAFMRKRFAIIQKITNASTIGIIVSTKIGQKRLVQARKLKRTADIKGKICEIILMNEILPERLVDLGFEAYVSTACSRIALDDDVKFDYPIGTPAELMISIGELKWEDYRIDDWNFKI